MKILALLLHKPFDVVLWLAKVVLFCAVTVIGMVICSVVVVLFYGSLLGAISFKEHMEDA
jgi:hypothetical protein